VCSSDLVTVHDFGLDEGRLYIVMEYVAGDDLKTMLKKRGHFSVDEAIHLMLQACAGIGYAHRAGLVHCDVKPHNMIVSHDGRLKVTDFGIARALSTIQPDEKTNVVWGSPQYFSPEQAAGLAPSPASDVYSLGVILYELVTGQLPFSANDPTELARLHRDVAPIRPRQINPSIPPALEQIILKVLSKEASARYRTADQFGLVLTNFVSQENQVVPASNLLIGKSNLPVNPDVSDTLDPNFKAHAAEHHPLDLDWVTIALGLLATLSVGGLIPFWLYVVLSVFPMK
jgi:serine/threonine-protein kinase